MSRPGVRWNLPAILLTAILIAGAAVRFYFADANSYWLDELYSVFIFWIENDSMWDVIRRLVYDIHPPLYQILLFSWMAVFGDSETATRTLSNLYIVGGTLCLYLSVRKVYGAWLGVIVSLVFTLMYTPTYYGMETRSYAQTIFLSSLSTLLLIHALPRISEKPWRQLAVDPWVLAFLAANVVLLFTHYYNVFFLGAQGLFIILYLLWRCDRREDAIAKSIILGAFPVLVLLAVWGPVMLWNYGRRSGAFTVNGLPRAPWETVLQMVIEPNFARDNGLLYAALALLAFVFVLTLVRLSRRPNDETLFTLWFLVAAVAPALLAFVLFLLSGHERYANRYFCFSVGPLAVLVVLGAYQATLLLRPVVPLPNKICLAATGILVVILAYPGSLNGLQKVKHDWRGIARAIVDRIGREPDKRFVVFETAFRSQPTLDYYLSKYSDDVRVLKTLRRINEKGQRSIEFATPDADFAVVAFTHHSISSFPKTLAVLGEKMALSEERLNKDGRGYIVFSVAND